MSESEIARRLCIGRTSVKRMLEDATVSEPPVPEPGEQGSQEG